MESKPAWRATPPPLLIAFGTWIIWVVARFAINMTLAPGRPSARLLLIGEGVSFACQILVLVGALELSQRFAGTARAFVRVALVGIALVIAMDTLAGCLQFTSEPWHHDWVYKVWAYVAVLGWNLFAFGLVQTLPPERRTLGYVALGVAFVAWLPPILHDPVWKLLALDGKTLTAVEIGLRVVRFVALGWLSIAASSGVTTANPPVAASGFRLAAKGLWLRVIVAVVVVMFSLLLLAANGRGSASLFKLMLMAQAVVSVIALLVTGVGGLRAARAGRPELSPFALTVGGGASLWAAGVALAQLPYVYKMLYGSDGVAGHDELGFTTALALALPIIVVVGVGLYATALSGYGAHRGNEEIRAAAQNKGLGFVLLMLVAIAVQHWVLPMASSRGGFAIYSLIGAMAGLWATVTVAKLFTRGAEILEAEPSLPTASLLAPDAN